MASFVMISWSPTNKALGDEEVGEITKAADVAIPLLLLCYTKSLKTRGALSRGDVLYPNSNEVAGTNVAD